MSREYGRRSAIAVLVLGVACAMTARGTAQTGTAPPLPTSPAPVVVPGTVEAFESADQYAKVSGFVSEVKADIGDHVKQGQVLAVIDDPELEKELAAGKAVLSAKRQLLRASEAAVLQAQATLEVARRQLVSVQAEQKLAEVTLKRQEELFAGKAVTDQQVDEARAKGEVTRAASATAEAKIGAAEADLAAAAANREVAAAQVEVTAADVGKTEAWLGYTKIVAPFDGVVTRRMVNRGDLVQAATASRTAPLLTCQRMDVVRVFCDVPEMSAAEVHAGNAVEVKVFGLKGEVIRGTVTRISGALQPETRTMRTEIDLDNAGERLRPGMYVQVSITR